MARRVVQVNVITYAVSAVGLIALAVLMWIVPGLIGPFQQPLSCEDYSIRNPKKTERVPSWLMLLVNILEGLLTIIAVEVFMNFAAKSDFRFKFRQWTVMALLVHTAAHIGYFATGFIMQMVLVQVVKHSVGRLRPHFFSVCWPSGYVTMCSDFHKDNKLFYTYKCAGDKKAVEEARLSFYSGHSALSVYTAVFLMLYIYVRIGSRLPRALLAFIQTVLLTTALYISITRIEDYYHHPTDALAGSIVGLLGAVFTCYFWADFFPKSGVYNPNHVKSSTGDSDSNPEARVDTRRSKRTSRHERHSSSNNKPSSSDDQQVAEIRASKTRVKSPITSNNNTTIVPQTEYDNTPSVATGIDVGCTQTVSKATQPPSPT